MSPIQADIDICRNEYLRQRKLEEIVSKRQPERPRTSKLQVALLYSLVPLLLCGVSLFPFLLPSDATVKLIVFVALLLFTFETYVRFCLLQTVRCYQHYAKEETRRRCMCVPSCSEYAIICLKKIFPLTLALIKIRIRLYKTCKGGEYKLDFPFKKMNAEYEKKYLD